MLNLGNLDFCCFTCMYLSLDCEQFKAKIFCRTNPHIFHAIHSNQIIILYYLSSAAENDGNLYYNTWYSSFFEISARNMNFFLSELGSLNLLLLRCFNVESKKWIDMKVTFQPVVPHHYISKLRGANEPIYQLSKHFEFPMNFNLRLIDRPIKRARLPCNSSLSNGFEQVHLYHQDIVFSRRS